MNTEERMLQLLVAAGLVSQAKMDETRKLAESFEEDEKLDTAAPSINRVHTDENQNGASPAHMNICPECLGPNGIHSSKCSLRPVVWVERWLPEKVLQFINGRSMKDSDVAEWIENELKKQLKSIEAMEPPNNA